MSRNGLVERIGEFGAATGGAVAIYVAFASVALIGALVLAIDIGRLTVVRSQMQNAVDAACISAVLQLDGQDKAIDRAEAVARNATAPTSDYGVTSGTDAITIGAGTTGIVFFTDNTLTTTTTTDANALAMRVTLDSRPVALLLQPALAVLSSATAQSFSNVGATAACSSAIIVCEPPSLMVCNAEDSPWLTDLRADSSAGLQIQLRKPGGGGAPAPGNFSLVCPPTGPCGATQVQDLLAAVGTSGCSGTGIDTKTGIAANPVNRGINSRFDLPNVPNPAKNIVTYPRDTSFITVATPYIGDAIWDPTTYWFDEHGGAMLPAGLEDYTRYQIYLYELDENFARHNGSNCDSGGGGTDCRTIYPLFEDGIAVDLPPGFAIVDPPGLNIPVSGVPTTMPVPDPADPRRRIFKTAVVDCTGFAGTEFINYSVITIVDMFLTEPAGDPSDFTVFLEVVRSRGTYDSSSNIINNAKLLD